MPRIAEYTAPDTTIRPSDLGAEAYQRSGYRIRADYDRIGSEVGGAIARVGGQIGAQVDQYDARQEISKGSSSLAGLQSTLLQSYNAGSKTSDPNDTTYGQKFMEAQVDPTLEKWQGSFTTKAGQEWALGEANRFRSHMTGVLIADSGARSADAMSVNLDDMKNHLSQLVTADPTSLGHALDLVDSSVSALVKNSPNLSPDAAAKAQGLMANHIKEEITRGAVLGAIQTNPGQAIQDLQAGKFGPYANGPELVTFAKAAQRQQITDARLARMEANQNSIMQSRATQGNIFKSLQVGSNGQYIVPGDWNKQILAQVTSGRLHVADAQDLIRFGQGQVAEAAKGVPVTTDPGVYSSLVTRAMSGTLDPSDVLKARVAGGLSDEDTKWLHETALSTQNSPQAKADGTAFVAAAKAFEPLMVKPAGVNMVTGEASAKDAPGGVMYSQFLRDAQQTFFRGRQSGLSADVLLDPKSPSYVFKNVQKYIMSDQAKQDWTANILKGAVPGAAPPAPGVAPAGATAYKPGESMDDYAKRLSGTK